MQKQTQLIDKLCRDVSKVQELVRTISKQFKLPFELSQPHEEKTLEAHNFLKHIGEWLATFGKTHSQQSKKVETISQELNLAQISVERLENNLQRISNDGNEARNKEQFLSTELELVQESLQKVKIDCEESYRREERVQRAN